MERLVELGGESSVGDALQVIVGLDVFLEGLTAVVNKTRVSPRSKQAENPTPGADHSGAGEVVDKNVPGATLLFQLMHTIRQ